MSISVRIPLAALALAAGCAAPGPAGSPLTRGQAQALLTSGEFACSEGEARWTSRFSTGGGYSYIYQDERIPGVWSLDSSEVEAARLCTTDEGFPGEQCFALLADGAGFSADRELGGRFTCAPL